jgi:uncharacterized delta-60 repeat protein
MRRFRTAVVSPAPARPSATSARRARGPAPIECLEPRTLLAASLLDPSFGGGDGLASADFRGGDDEAVKVVVLADGKLLVAGTATSAANGRDIAVARFNPDGTPDTTFGTGGKTTTDFHKLDDSAANLALLPDGRFVVVGSTALRTGSEPTETNLGVVRFLPNGARDRSFDGDGKATLDLGGNDTATGVVVMPDGDLVVTGTAEGADGSDFVAVRYNPDGSRDKSFGGGDGIVTTDFAEGDSGPTYDRANDAVRVANNKFVVVGSANSDLALARYNADGSLDRAFGGGDGRATYRTGDASSANAVEVLADGDLLVAGDVSHGYDYGGSYGILVARFNSDGTPDVSFGDRGFNELSESYYDPRGRDVAVMGDGTFLVAADGGVSRLDPFGFPVTAFSSDIYHPMGIERVTAIAVAAGQKPILAGASSTAETGRDLAVARLKRVDVPPAPADPDDQLREAPSLALGKSIDGRIDSPTDVDMVRFQVAAGHRVVFDVDVPARSEFDPLLRVFSASGQEIGASDDAPAPGEGAMTLESYARLYFPEAGTYYAAVSGSPNDHYDPRTGAGDVPGSGASAGAYRLTITDVPVPQDRDDQIREAIALPVGSRRAGSIDNDLDVDLYRITAAAGQEIRVDIDVPATNGLNAWVRLFDAGGRPLDLGSNNQAPGEEWDDREIYAVYRFEEAGTYYLGVSGRGNDAYDAATGSGDRPAGTGEYEIILGDLPLDADDQISEAKSLPADGSRSATISPDTDVDMYKFTVAAGRHVAVDLDRSGASWGYFLVRLFGADGTQLDSNVNTSAPGEFGEGEAYLEFVAPRAGTYYVGVSDESNSDYDPLGGGNDNSAGNKGTYILRLTALAADSDDTLGEARHSSLGSTLSGSIGTPTDVDMVRFDAAPGAKFGLDIDLPAGSALQPYLRLFDGDGNEITSNDVAPAPGEQPGNESYIEFIVPDDAAGTYFVGVSGWPDIAYAPITGTYDTPGSTGSYKLVLQRFTAPTRPDPDDQIAEATRLTLGRPVTGTIGEQDVDMYAFTVRAGDFVNAELTDVTFNPMLRIFDSKGVQLDPNAPFPLAFPQAGTYYAAVSGAINDRYDPVTGRGDRFAQAGSYRLTVSVVPPPPGALDPDDTLAEAIRLTPGTARSGRIDPRADVDLYRFDAAAGTEYLITVGDDFTGRSHTDYVRVFNSAGEYVAEGNGFVRLEVGDSDRYFIGVSNSDNSGYDPRTGRNDNDFGPTFDYFILAQASPADPDDQLAEAVVTSVGSTRSGKIDSPFDVDLYKFTARAGQRVGFDVDLPDDDLDTLLRLFNTGGVQLLDNDDGLAPGERNTDGASYLEYVFKTAGTYYVGVSSISNSGYDPTSGRGDSPGATGSYTLRLSSPPE